MILSMRKGAYPFFSPDIQMIWTGMQYQIGACVTNSSGAANGEAAILFYWAAAATPGSQPQLNGWTVPAWIQPTPVGSNPTTPPTIIFPLTISAPISISWQPDINVKNAIAASFDPGHIMIIAQLISLDPLGINPPVAHPLDFNWWPGANTWTAAAIFNWP